MALVALLMGSERDREAVRPCLEALEGLGIPYEVHVLSAHRQPERVRQFALGAKEQGIEVIIAAAGLSAALPGAVAAWTTLPVIGLPLAAGELRGLDSLLSIAQMPAGVPVACVGIGQARNAALLAAAILALKHEDIRQAYEKYRQEQAR